MREDAETYFSSHRFLTKMTKKDLLKMLLSFPGFGDQYFRPPFDQVLMATIGVLLMLKVLNL